MVDQLKRPMKDRHLRFCILVLQGKTPLEAALGVGYAKGRSASTQASRLMTRVDVSTYIDDHRDRAADSINLDTAFVLNGLADNAIQAKKLEKPDYAASNKAFELLGKHLKMFVDRTEVVIPGEMLIFLDSVINLIDHEVRDPATRQRILVGLAQIQVELNPSLKVGP